MTETPRGGAEAKWQRSMAESSPYLGLGFQLAGAVLIYTGLGYLVDRWLDTTPWGLVTGAVVGMVAFFIQLIRVVRQMNARTRREAPGKKYRSVDDDPWADEAQPVDEWEDEWDRDSKWRDEGANSK